MKKQLIIGASATAILAGAVLTAAPAFASDGNGYRDQTGSAEHGQTGRGYEAMLESKAKLFGFTVDQLKEQLKTKSVLDIAKEKGISEDKLHAAMQEQAKARWQERGFSDAEINKRLEQMRTRQADCDGTAESGHQHRGSVAK